MRFNFMFGLFLVSIVVLAALLNGSSPAAVAQAFGGAGVSGDTPLAELYAGVRTLRIADGPDEVHNRTIARLEYAKHGGR